MMLITRKKLKHEKQHKTNDHTFDVIAYDFFATVKKQSSVFYSMQVQR
jgi:hypothetical protein